MKQVTLFEILFGGDLQCTCDMASKLLHWLHALHNALPQCATYAQPMYC